jgi:hypothetical protein
MKVIKSASPLRTNTIKHVSGVMRLTRRYKRFIALALRIKLPTVI